MNGHLPVKRTLQFACKQVGNGISYLQNQHNALTVNITLQFLGVFYIVHLQNEPRYTNYTQQHNFSKYSLCELSTAEDR